MSKFLRGLFPWDDDEDEEGEDRQADHDSAAIDDAEESQIAVSQSPLDSEILHRFEHVELQSQEQQPYVQRGYRDRWIKWPDDAEIAPGMELCLMDAPPGSCSGYSAAEILEHTMTQCLRLVADYGGHSLCLIKVGITGTVAQRWRYYEEENWSNWQVMRVIYIYIYH